MDEYNGPGNLEIGTGESERERANSILSGNMLLHLITTSTNVYTHDYSRSHYPIYTISNIYWVHVLRSNTWVFFWKLSREFLDSFPFGNISS